MYARGIIGILNIIYIHDTIDVSHPCDADDILTRPTSTRSSPSRHRSADITYLGTTQRHCPGFGGGSGDGASVPALLFWRVPQTPLLCTFSP